MISVNDGLDNIVEKFFQKAKSSMRVASSQDSVVKGERQISLYRSPSE